MKGGGRRRATSWKSIQDLSLCLDSAPASAFSTFQIKHVVKMRFIFLLLGFVVTSSQFLLASGLTISEINRHKFLSSYAGQVADVKGMATAKGSSGFWINSTALDLDYTSFNSVYVFGSSVGKDLTVGDVIILDATVSEYRELVPEVFAPHQDCGSFRGLSKDPRPGNFAGNLRQQRCNK
jgi:hypothetical protein